MASHIAEGPRRIPRQERGERRVAQLLHAAAQVIAATGYEATTMSAIAERAGAPIGSLYQFFPNKQAVTHALRTQYGKYYEAQLIALQADAKNLSLDRLVGRLVTLSLDFIETHPAFLPLLEAPPSTRSPLSLRRTLRRRLSQCLAGVTPSVNRPKALRCATVTLEMLKGLSHLYGEVPAPKRRQVVSEYRIALSSYLGARLGAGHTR